MKRKHLSLLALFLLLIPLIVFSYSKNNSGGEKISLLKGSFNLENSIIIRELKMDSDTPPEDHEGDIPGSGGQIIYDDDFDDRIVDDNDLEKPAREKPVKPKRKTRLKDLQKKDSRWHLTRYRIRKNDNLWKIAKRFGVSHRLIIRINNINDPDMLLPGKSIDIPSRRGVYYRVKRGDTLSGIAKRYGTRTGKIRRHNRLKGKYLLAGKKIFIPGVVRKRGSGAAAKRQVKRKRLAASRQTKIRFTWPLRGRLTSGFGTRKDPFSKRRQFHCGIDISANIGKKIKASAGGKVIFSGWKHGYGKVVIIRHKYGYITVYAHNSRNLAKRGKKVRRGEVIALSGNTGAVTGAHLHFEIRKYVTPLNPIRLLR
jgi:murein DD-endopeptidase MepM/ murein hydrolase activator NlpD